MSYTFNREGGTNHGIKDYNQIFGLNRTTVGASNYWNPDLQPGDTVIMKLEYTHDSTLMYNYKLLYYHDFDNAGAEVYGKHWVGTGLYLCYNKDNQTIDPGDFVCQWSGNPVPTGISAPLVEVASTSGEATQPMGVALEQASAGSYVLVAMMGLWPMKRAVTLPLNVAIFSTFNGTGAVTTAVPSGSYKKGAFGKCIRADFGIIASADAVPDEDNGALCCIWGTSAETY